MEETGVVREGRNSMKEVNQRSWDMKGSRGGWSDRWTRVRRNDQEGVERLGVWNFTGSESGVWRRKVIDIN